MDQFVIKAKHKNIFIAMMALGALCLVLTWFNDDALHTRFWTNWLHNSVFFTGIGFASLFLLCAGILTYASWYVAFKRIWEAYSQFIIIGLGLLIVIILGIWGHFHHLYHWADAEDVQKDVILKGKSAFLNPVWYTLGTIIILGTWYFFARKLRALSIEEDQHGGDGQYTQYKKSKYFAAVFLPIAGFTSVAVIWQWLMSLDAHWYSTMYGWYATASWVVSTFSMTIILIIILKNNGYLNFVTIEHLHDLGKFVFAISIFWTYLWFSQFMLIWYGNNGEETIYFDERMQHYPVLFYGNLILNFVLPFLILLRNDTKRKYGSLLFVCIVVVFGHWIDFFQMIKPGALHTAHEALAKMAPAAEHGHDAHGHHSSFTPGFTIPGLLELGTFIGFLGLFMFAAFRQLTKAPLAAKNDPFFAETVHHHVQ